MNLDTIVTTDGRQEATQPTIRQSALRRGLSLYAQAQLGQSLAQQTAAAFQTWLAEECEDAGIELPPDSNVSVDFKTGSVSMPQRGG